MYRGDLGLTAQSTYDSPGGVHNYVHVCIPNGHRPQCGEGRRGLEEGVTGTTGDIRHAFNNKQRSEKPNKQINNNKNQLVTRTPDLCSLAGSSV